MKSTIIPAQVTSIEDMITAKLSLTQIVLLVIPVFITALDFTVLPPVLHIRIYKIIVTLVLAIPIMSLALRIRGQILLRWLVVLFAYQIRPHRYFLTTMNLCSCSLNEPLNENYDTKKTPTTDYVVNLKDLKPAESLVVSNFLIDKQIYYLADSKGRLDAVIETR